MGFTVRFMLGAVLALSCCWSSETISRQIRQVHNNNGESEAEKTTQQSIVANLTEESSKPKTDFSTEDNTNIDKQNSISKLQKSETYKKATNQPDVQNFREDIARSINIDKYVSKEFHNRNNIYAVSVSPDTEKYIEPDYSYRPTTRHDQDYTKDFHFDAELTTPTSLIFDHKYKERVESVEQKLEHIDDSHELSSESESKENLNLEKLYDETQNNDTKANLNYINYRSIISNDTGDKNSVHKDLVVEAGTNLVFRSSYNETKIIDENDNDNDTIVSKSANEDKLDTATPTTIQHKGDQEGSESSTAKSIILTTRKNIVLTKPPSNKNTSHISILSNNIETETVKAINQVQLNSLSTTEKPKGEKETVEDYVYTKYPIDISKRGKVSLADYASTQSSVISNEIKKKSEQLQQENQVVPIHVEAPSSTVYPERLITPTVTTEKQTTSELISTLSYATTTEMTTEETITGTNSVTELVTDTTPTMETTTTLPEQKITTVTTPGSTVNTVTETTTEAIEAETTTVDIITTTGVFTTTSPVTESLTTVEPNPNTTVFSNDTVTTPESSTESTNSPTTETVTDMPTTTLESFERAIAFNDSDKNVTTMTTENTLRTSKGIVFRETVPPTVPASTTTETVPTTQPIEEHTTVEPIPSTFKVPETQTDEQAVTTTTETNFIVAENRTTYLIPDVKQEQNESTTEMDNTTDGNTVTPDSFNTIPPDDNSGTIAAITISSIGAICLILLAGLLVIMRKRQKRFNYGQRCTPVSLDIYSIDNVSAHNSVRRKGDLRSSKRSYGNPAFEDPASISHPLNFPALGKFVNNLEDMRAEFEEIPQITARTNELPEGCDVKNRYANVIPLPETRVSLSYIDGYSNSDYINANYVTGPKNVKGYYIACQAPMQNTVDDFWRMVWEQQCKVILMLTHLYENGIEKCFDYLPPSEVLDCHRAFGDFLVTLKKREVKDKYIISTLQLKNMVSSSWREVTHFWYLGWPEKGVPSEANSLIAFLIEARSYMKSSSIDRNATNNHLTNGTAKNELTPVVVHCSPGTGRTGVVIACDIAIREFEQTRLVDIPRIVYKIRRDRASAVQTKEQYAFIYKVVNLYATKLTGDALDSF